MVEKNWWRIIHPPKRDILGMHPGGTCWSKLEVVESRVESPKQLGSLASGLSGVSRKIILIQNKIRHQPTNQQKETLTKINK